MALAPRSSRLTLCGIGRLPPVIPAQAGIQAPSTALGEGRGEGRTYPQPPPFREGAGG